MEKRLKRVRDRAHSQFKKYMGLESALALRLWSIRASKRLFLFLLLALLVLSCSKRSNRIDRLSPPDRAGVSKTLTLNEALDEVRNLNAPEGADKELFNSLKAQLEKMLIARGADKFPSAPPSADAGNVINLLTDPAGLNWNEARAGDWNNDGIVKADDVVPLAIHLGKGDDPDAPNYYKYAGYIDGDGDGLIGIGDVQAIADHFADSTIGYNIYEALDSSGTGGTKVATVLRPPVPLDPDNPPWNLSFATLEYDTATGSALPSALRKIAGGSRTAPTVLTSGASSVIARDEVPKQFLTIPPNWIPTSGKFYSVVPYGQGFDEQGAPIFVERFNLASNWVYVNIPPVAIFKADPDTGEAPVTVTFDASDSYDADGYILNYVWDFDGDGLTDTITQTPITSKYYRTPGTRSVSLSVYDNTGESSTRTTVNLSVISGHKTPIAEANASLPSGKAPLWVDFNGEGSYDPDGDIVLYRWDFDADGIWDLEDTTGVGKFKYRTMGLFHSLLEVVDNEGLTATDTVTVFVDGYLRWVEEPLDAGTQMILGNDGKPLVLIYRKDGVYLARRLGESWEEHMIQDLPEGYGVTDFAQAPDGTIWVALIELDGDEILASRLSGYRLQEVYSIDQLGVYFGNIDVEAGSDGRPAIAYFNNKDFSYRLAWWNGSDWDIHIIEAFEGNSGVNITLAFDKQGVPSVSYYYPAGGLIFSRWNGASWDRQVVEGLGGGRHSLAYDSDGNPALAYRGPDMSLRLARWDGNGWQYESFTQWIPGFTSLLFDSSGHPAMFFRIAQNDGTGQVLMLLRNDSQQWYAEKVDEEDGISGISTVLLPTGKFAFTYTIARLTDSGWQYRTVYVWEQ